MGVSFILKQGNICRKWQEYRSVVLHFSAYFTTERRILMAIQNFVQRIHFRKVGAFSLFKRIGKFTFLVYFQNGICTVLIRFDLLVFKRSCKREIAVQSPIDSKCRLMLHRFVFSEYFPYFVYIPCKSCLAAQVGTTRFSRFFCSSDGQPGGKPSVNANYRELGKNMPIPFCRC